MPRKWVSGERSTSLESMLGDAMPMKAASTSLRERMCHEADMLERHKRENWGKAWVTLDRATEMRACNRNNRPRERLFLNNLTQTWRTPLYGDAIRG